MKINKLLQKWPAHTVATASWLDINGLYPSLREKYVKSGWIESFGTGAYIRKNDVVSVEGALHALQYQLGKNIHIAARSALDRKGQGHYVRLGDPKLFLFSRSGQAIEGWFINHHWKSTIKLIRTDSILNDFGLEEEQVMDFKIRVSSSERAILEMLCFTPNVFDFNECASIMEHLAWLRSDLIQNLLENCTSVKAKRLFLFLGDYYGHEWMSKLDMKNIELGSGKRALFKNGRFNAKFQITIPKDFQKNESSPLF